MFNFNDVDIHAKHEIIHSQPKVTKHNLPYANALFPTTTTTTTTTTTNNQQPTTNNQQPTTNNQQPTTNNNNNNQQQPTAPNL